jgi:HK97 family phage major capsid protein
VFDEFQYAFAKKIDQVVFSGDGTAASFGISGFRTKLLDVDGTIGNIAGLAVASGNLFSEYTLADFQSAYGILPEYAEDNAQWVTHKKAYSATALRSALAAGGVFANEVNAYGGEKVKTFLDYPVNFVQNMPSADANSQIAHLLGNFPRAAKIGLVAGSLALDTDSSYRFGNGQIAYRMIQHVAVNVHDVGSTTEAGPVVGIISAAS